MRDGFHNAPHVTLRADNGERWVGVHELSECVFCARAGLIVVEQDRDDEGEEEQKQARLGYRPPYIPREIEAGLERIGQELILLFAALMMTLAVTMILMRLVDHRIVWLGVVMMLYVVSRMPERIWQYLEWAALRRQAMRAPPRRPTADLQEEQAVNWWELLQTGCAAKRYREPFSDPELKLAGRPFQVLLDGPLKIPVIRVNNPEKRVHPNHRARIAAYCRLIEVCLGGESPYGIVLFGRTYDGIAVPHQREARDAFHGGLVQIRELARKTAGEPVHVDPPEKPSKCSGCPWGRPFSLEHCEQEHRRFGSLLPVFQAASATRVLYHSHCGDRFGWVPPHEKARELELEPLDSP